MHINYKKLSEVTNQYEANYLHYNIRRVIACILIDTSTQSSNVII